MKYFPTFLNLQHEPCLVIGGGDMALKKAELILRAGADVTILSPSFELDPCALLGLPEHRVSLLDDDLSIDLLQRYRLVIAASGIASLDERAAELARSAGIPVNVVDRTDLCTFVMPAIVERGDVVIGISTGGASPVLARRIRARIEAVLPSRLAELAAFAGSFREAVKARLPFSRRRTFWQQVVDGEIGRQVLSGKTHKARENMLALLNAEGRSRRDRGFVSIVGTGPGDPDLLTLKALQALQDADVILYDKLIGPKILDYARRDAERIFVGKSRACHYKTQDEINRLMVFHANKGRHVLRLKGGDPLIFGRGGEEIEELKKHKIDVEVVPGITAASGCAAASLIPLTHRDHAKSVTFVTGHSADGEPDLDWTALAAKDQTLVFYMGVSNASMIAHRLVSQGLSGSTPVAVIINGTLESQRVIKTCLSDLEASVAGADLDGPALLIVGDVVAAAGSDLLHLADPEDIRRSA